MMSGTKHGSSSCCTAHPALLLVAPLGQEQWQFNYAYTSTFLLLLEYRRCGRNKCHRIGGVLLVPVSNSACVRLKATPVHSTAPCRSMVYAHTAAAPAAAPVLSGVGV